MSEQVLFRAQDLTKVYRNGGDKITAVDGISLEVKRGDFIAFVGPAGSGKTTLLNILGCLDNPTSGRLELDGQLIFDQGRCLGESRLTMLRRELFGYIFQDFSLIPNLTVFENVVLPFAFNRKPGAEKGVNEIMVMLGIDRRRHHLPEQISGSELQRVALARALINNPKILLADEPTEHLNTRHSREVGILLNELNRWNGLTVVLVTHNPELARMANTMIELRDGKIFSRSDDRAPDENSI